MRARRHAILAVLAALSAVLAVVLWWLSRDVVSVAPPVLEPPVEGMLERTRTVTWLLLAATVAAGTAMVLTTLAILSARSRDTR